MTTTIDTSLITKILIELKVKESDIRNLKNIFYDNMEPMNFFINYKFVAKFTHMSEEDNFISNLKDQWSGPIKMRKGRRPNQKVKKRKKIWVSIKKIYYRSLFMKSGCKLHDKKSKIIIKLKKENKIKFLNFFFKWFQKRPRAFLLTKDFWKQIKSGRKLRIIDQNITDGDRIICSFNVFKSSLKKFFAHFDEEDFFIPDYKRIRGIGHGINIVFIFSDNNKGDDDLKFYFRGFGHDSCTINIILNRSYLKYFYKAEWFYRMAVIWHNKLVIMRNYNLYRGVANYRLEFLFEYWKAYKEDFWFRKYWDPDWPKIIGGIMSTIKYHAKENIINTKRYALNVSREEAIRLVEEDRLRARAENIILKQQMKLKLEKLDLIDDIKDTNKLIDEKKKNGIHLSFIQAFSEIQRRRQEYKKRTAEIIAINTIIAQEMIAESKRTYQPPKRELRIFKNL